MMEQYESINRKSELKQFYFLTQILKSRVFWRGKKVGKLSDVVIVENGKLPEVTHIYVTRSFGYASLLVPLEKIRLMSAKETVVELSDLESYEREPAPDAVLLSDHILDKKVLDIDDREVEVVYDVKMVAQNGRLFVSDVDLSKYGLLRRLRLKPLADLIYQPHQRLNPKLVSWTLVQPLPTQLNSFKGEVKLKVLKERLADMYPVDIADILEEMDQTQRVKIFSELDVSRASDTLEEIDPNVQRELIRALGKDKVAQLINLMTPAQAADILSVLPIAEADSIMKLLDPEKVKKIEAIIEQQEQKIINYATQSILKFSPDETVAKVEEEYHKIARGKDVIMYIYIVEKQDRLIGVLDLKELMQADNSAVLRDIMVDNVIALEESSKLKDARDMFSRYGFRALPVIGKNDQLLGALTYRDVMNLRHRFI
ncbi:MAG: CBS domain-containing protein [bacterium]|nr:CBS domain-containing protein [bacterium]